MDRKSITVVVMSIVIVGLAVTAVYARSWTTTTPLYTYRMEQASNKMNFLPTEMAGFTYNAEKGYTIPFETVKPSEDIPLDTWQTPWTCVFSTCVNTCETCDGPTCPVTCPVTCNTCPSTCETCETCPATCPFTCSDTHFVTCEGCQTNEPCK